AGRERAGHVGADVAVPARGPGLRWGARRVRDEFRTREPFERLTSHERTDSNYQSAAYASRRAGGRRAGAPSARRALSPRAGSALLPDARIDPGRRRPGAGDPAARLAGA